MKSAVKAFVMQQHLSSNWIQSISSILFLTFCTWSTLSAQAPQKMSYQSVVRDAGGALVTNSPVGVQISIIRDSTNGTVVYEETHSLTTNTNGLATLEIGTGAVVTGVFDTIDWSEGPYFLKSETDPEGGTNYTVSSTSQLMSVPYAMHADNAHWQEIQSSIHNKNAGNVGIGTPTPHPSALLEIQSDSSGLLIPRMDSAQREDIPTPATGLMVYQTDNRAGYYYFDGVRWIPFDLEGRLGDVLEQQDIQCPTIAGSLGIGAGPWSMAVQGVYAYVVDLNSDDLKVIDVSDPTDPDIAGSIGIGSGPVSISVQGDYAYVVDIGSDDLKVIDVSDPMNPTIAGSLGLGSDPASVSVLGDYAYVVDQASEDLKVIDVSDPTDPDITGSIGIGSGPTSVEVQGDYAYVVDLDSEDLKVIDVSDPMNPTIAGNLGLGSGPVSISVQGDYAYVVDHGSDDLKVLELACTDQLFNVRVLNDNLEFGKANWKQAGDHIHSANTGNVGIGTSSPQHTLEVRSSSTPDFEGIIHAEYTGNGLNPNGDIINPYGIYVKSEGNDNNGVGGRFEGGFIGVDGYVMPTGSGYVSTGVSGTVVGGNGENYGVRANASGFGTNYGIYATGSLGTTDYAGYFSGDVTITGTLTNPSDVKFKKDINIYKDALQKLNDVNVYSFKYRQIGSMNFPGKKRIGFIAQDLEKPFPGLVKEEVDAVPGKAPGNLRRVIRYKGVNYIGMIPILTQAIKEQQSEISSLKIEKKEIKNENRHLRERLNSLEKEVAEIKVLLDNT